MLRVKRADLQRRGVARLRQRVAGVEGGRPLLDDGTVIDAKSVVWCTGFQQAFDWIDVPAFDQAGWPDEYRGVVEKAPGLYFCGLSFQFSFSSMVLAGVGRDAEFVVEHLVARTDEDPRLSGRHPKR